MTIGDTATNSNFYILKRSFCLEILPIPKIIATEPLPLCSTNAQTLLQMTSFHAASGSACGGQETVVVHFLDNSSKTILINDDTEVDEVCQEIYDRLQIKDENIPVEYFALYYSDGSICDQMLEKKEKIVDLIDRSAKIVFQIRLLMHRTVLSKCPVVSNLLYIQSMHYVITGQYRINEEDAARLAAVVAVERYGNRHPNDPLRTGILESGIHELIPHDLLQYKSAKLWAEDILDKYHHILSIDDVFSPKMTYLSLLESLPSTCDSFLCTLYPCAQTNAAEGIPDKVVVGINADGIKILNSNTLKLIDEYQLTELYQWGFENSDRSFYLRLHEEDEKTIFQSPKGVEMSVLLTDIAVARINDVSVNDDSGEDDDESSEDEEDATLRKMVTLQALWRGAIHRRLQKKEYAVILLQSLYRGHAARKQFDQILLEMEAER